MDNPRAPEKWPVVVGFSIGPQCDQTDQTTHSNYTSISILPMILVICFNLSSQLYHLINTAQTVVPNDVFCDILAWVGYRGKDLNRKAHNNKQKEPQTLWTGESGEIPCGSGTSDTLHTYSCSTAGSIYGDSSSFKWYVVSENVSLYDGK